MPSNSGTLANEKAYAPNEKWDVKKNPAKKYDKIWITPASIYAEYFTLLKSFVKIAILECEKSYIQLVLGGDNVHLRDFAVTVKARSELLRANHGVEGRESPTVDAQPFAAAPMVNPAVSECSQQTGAIYSH